MILEIHIFRNIILKNVLLSIFILSAFNSSKAQENERIKTREFYEKKFHAVLKNDSLYGRGNLFKKGNLMIGSTVGLEFGFVTGGPADNHFVLQLGPNINYFPVKRWMVGLNSIQYASWTTSYPPRYYWDLGVQTRYYFLNHRSITIYPFVNYFFGNFDGYVNYNQNYKRKEIYQKIRAGAGINFRVHKTFTINFDLGWWQFLNKPSDLNRSGTVNYSLGFNYVFSTKK